MKYRSALVSGVAVYLASAACVSFGVYDAHPNIDIPFHIAGGITAGMFAIALHDDFKRRHQIGRTPRWYDLLFILGFVALIAIAWEVHEFVLDRTIVLTYHTAINQISVADTIGDFLNGLIGATIAFVAFGRFSQKH
jgi:peptidoglycan/LPS O-acetylase OafA/YrhL